MIPWAPLLLSDDALEILSGRKWPGNVRELLHVIERAVVFASDDSLGADDFPEDDVSKTPGPPGSLQEHVDQTSREHVLSVLDRTN